MLELWHDWNSVHSFKVRVVLAEKALDWIGHRVELLEFEHLRPEYLRLNPAGVVPTLVHDGRVLTESSVIVQYLEDAFPHPALLPADPYARARARLWLKYFDDAVHPAVRAASFPLLYRQVLRRRPRVELEAQLAGHPDPARAKSFLDALQGAPEQKALNLALERFSSIISRIEDALPERDWLSGSEFGLIDAAMAAFAQRVDNLGLQSLWPAGSRAAQWRVRVLARDSVVASCAPPEHRLAAKLAAISGNAGAGPTPRSSASRGPTGRT